VCGFRKENNYENLHRLSLTLWCQFVSRDFSIFRRCQRKEAEAKVREAQEKYLLEFRDYVLRNKLRADEFVVDDATNNPANCGFDVFVREDEEVSA
jgi:hypothetical protein